MSTLFSILMLWSWIISILIIASVVVRKLAIHEANKLPIRVALKDSKKRNRPGSW